MSKSMEELMFGAENQAAVAKAVQDAVARADAAGLPPAYKHLPLEGLPPNPEKVALHQAAVAEEKAKDRRWLEFHQKALDLLFAGGEVDEDLKRQALERLQLFKERQVGHPDWIAMWHELLNSPAEAARSVILAENEGGHCLRKNTPLSFLALVLEKHAGR